MSDKVFLDTNILIYAYSSNEPAKRARVTELIDNLSNVILSTQVVNELINVFRKKMKFETHDVNKVLQELMERFEIVTISMNTIRHAVHISDKYRYTPTSIA